MSEKALSLVGACRWWYNGLVGRISTDKLDSMGGEGPSSPLALDCLGPQKEITSILSCAWKKDGQPVQIFKHSSDLIPVSGP